LLLAASGTGAMEAAICNLFKKGDEVIVFNEEYRIEELAKQINTIPYEILTNVSQRVKRVYFYE